MKKGIRTAISCILLSTACVYAQLVVPANIQQKIAETTNVVNEATRDQQQRALDRIYDAAYHSKNKQVQIVAWSMLGGLQLKFEAETYSWSRAVDVGLLARFPGPSKVIVSYEAAWATKPVQDNISDIYIEPEIQWAEAMGWQLIFDWRHEFVYSVFWTTEPTLTIQGKVRSDIANIEVVRDWDGRVDTIDKFTPWDKDFSYNIGIKNWNMKLGGNAYLIRGYAKNAIYSALVTVVYLEPWTKSLVGGEVIEKWQWETIDPRLKKFSDCYVDKNEGDEDLIQQCMATIIKDATISQSKACSLEDGRHFNYLDAQRPNKVALISQLYKKGSKLYYPLQLGTSSPTCEDAWYEIHVYSLDCDADERVKIVANDPNEEKFAKCEMAIVYADDQSILVKKMPYERYGGTYEGYELVDQSSKQSEKIRVFDGIELIGTGWETKATSGFTNNQVVIHMVEKIINTYSLVDVVSPGFTYEIINVDDALKATVRITIYALPDVALYYDVPVDLAKKAFIATN